MRACRQKLFDANPIHRRALLHGNVPCSLHFIVPFCGLGNISSLFPSFMLHLAICYCHIKVKVVTKLILTTSPERNQSVHLEFLPKTTLLQSNSCPFTCLLTWIKSRNKLTVSHPGDYLARARTWRSWWEGFLRKVDWQRTLTNISCFICQYVCTRYVSRSDAKSALCGKIFNCNGINIFCRESNWTGPFAVVVHSTRLPQAHTWSVSPSPLPSHQG